MTLTDARRSRRASTSASSADAAGHGPMARIVVGSVTLGVVASAVLTLGVFAGAQEHIITGVTLLSFAAGWAMLAALTTRMTSRPQRWAWLPAGFLAVSGLAMTTLALGDDGLTAAAWVWPPVLLAIVIWSQRQLRSSMFGRSRWLLYTLLGALALSSVGALVQNVSMQRDSATMQMPGALYDVGGLRLHLHCTGTGSPTVVLENSLSGSSPTWARIVEGTAPTTRVCAYDRSGQGWSEDAPAPQDSIATADSLHALLDAAGEDGPYVLAGYSSGGVYAMTFAARYPEQVAGMALLDSASPQQFTVLPAYAGQYEMMTRLYSVLPGLARLGLGTALSALYSNDLPGEAGEQAAAFARDPRSSRNARDEVSTFRRAFAQAQALTSLGDKPLLVLSASETLSGTDGWPIAQAQLAALSTNADQRTVNSSHAALLDNPAAARAGVAAIGDVVAAARTGGDVRTD